jgi:hypothetical protein
MDPKDRQDRRVNKAIQVKTDRLDLADPREEKVP